MRASLGGGSSVTEVKSSQHDRKKQRCAGDGSLLPNHKATFDKQQYSENNSFL